MLLGLTVLIAVTPVSADAENILDPGERLNRGEGLVSDNGRYRLILQNDGNLVLYKNRRTALWSSRTDGLSAQYCEMQKDGNLVIYNYADKPIWASQTNDTKNVNSILILQDDGNLVIYRADETTPTWASGTNEKPRTVKID